MKKGANRGRRQEPLGENVGGGVAVKSLPTLGKTGELSNNR